MKKQDAEKPGAKQYCESGGWLVGGEDTVPDDPSEFRHRSVGYGTGCNRVFCSRCESLVRQRPGLSIRLARKGGREGQQVDELDDGHYGADIDPSRDKYSSPTASDTRSMLEALWESDRWSELPFVELRSSLTRLYACQCHSWRATLPQALVDYDYDPADPMDRIPPGYWACGGHPLPRLPVQVDGVVIDEGFDFAPLVDRVLAAHEPPGITHGQYSDSPARWLFRLYTRTLGTGSEDRLSRVLAERAIGPSDERRGGALLFFACFPEAAGATRVCEYALELSAEQLSQSFPILRTRADREEERRYSTHSFLGVLKNQLPEGDGGDGAAATAPLQKSVVELFRRQLLSAGRFPVPEATNVDLSQRFLATVVRADAEWIAHSVVAIVQANPGLQQPLLDILYRLGRQELIVVAGVALAKAETGTDLEGLRAWANQERNRFNPWGPVIRRALDSAGEGA